MTCFKPGNYNLSQNILESDQAGQLIELASKGLLLEDPLESGALITAFYRTEGDSDQLHANILEAGGPAQEKAFILLDNQLKSYAQVTKAKAEGKRLSCPNCNYKGTFGDFKKVVGWVMCQAICMELGFWRVLSAEYMQKRWDRYRHETHKFSVNFVFIFK